MLRITKRKSLRSEGKASLSVTLRASARDIFKLRRMQMISSESTRATRLSGLERIMLDHTGNIWRKSAETDLYSDARKELFIEPSWTKSMLRASVTVKLRKKRVDRNFKRLVKRRCYKQLVSFFVN